MSALAPRTRGRTMPLSPERVAPDRSRRDRHERSSPRRDGGPCSDAGRPTLEQRLDRVWAGLRAVGVAVCPVCGGRMAAAEDSGSGRCGSCGSTLS